MLIPTRFEGFMAEHPEGEALQKKEHMELDREIHFSL